MHAFQTRLKLILSSMLLIIFSTYSVRIYPHKNKIVNIQEILLLINLTAMYAVSYQGSEKIFCFLVNIMIFLVFLQFFIIILHHFIAYTCQCDVVNVLQTLLGRLLKICYKSYFKDNSLFDVELLNIPEHTYYYSEN